MRWSGHGDIDLGDSFGSILSQITLVLGIIAVLGRDFRVKRHEVLVIGTFEVSALTLSISVAITGFTKVGETSIIGVVQTPAALSAIHPKLGEKHKCLLEGGISEEKVLQNELRSRGNPHRIYFFFLLGMINPVSVLYFRYSSP